jgi:hypothetical protein
MRVQRKKQLSVYLENRVGALAELCNIIEQQSINIIGICAVDTIEEAVLRIVPEDELTACSFLKEKGFGVIETEILVIEIPNVPGATGRVASRLSRAGVNIDYIYASAHPEEAKAIIILKTRQINEAESILVKE